MNDYSWTNDSTSGSSTVQSTQSTSLQHCVAVAKAWCNKLFKLKKNRTRAVTARSLQRDLQTATSIAVFDQPQSIRKGLRPVLNTSNYVFITRSADDYIPKMRHREARLDKRNVTYVGIYTSVKLIVREVLEVFCGFYFYRRGGIFHESRLSFW